MIKFGTLGSDPCSPCENGRLHFVTACAVRWGWQMDTLNLGYMSGVQEKPGQTYDGSNWQLHPSERWRVFSRLNWSGLSVNSAWNGNHDISKSNGPATGSDFQTNANKPRAWMADLLDSTWRWAVTAQTSTSVSIGIYERGTWNFETGDWNYNLHHTCVLTLSNENTDEDVYALLDALLDGIDWDDVLLFDPAHHFSYTAFPCPASLAGSTAFDSYCVGDPISTASAGDTIICFHMTPGSETKRCNVSYGTRTNLPPAYPLSWIYSEANGWLYGGGSKGTAYLSRLRMHAPVSYSWSTYGKDHGERTYYSGWGEEIIDDSWADWTNPLFDIEDPEQRISRFGDWSQRDTCTDVSITTSLSSPVFIEAPALISGTPHALKQLRRGIRCADV